MPARTSAIAAATALAVALGVYLTAAAASCPPPNAPDDGACDAARPNTTRTAQCTADAQRTETCADKSTGITHALYLTRAASEWRKAAIVSNPRTMQARRWLAHAMVLDERVQDNPDAPPVLRKRAKLDEALAKAALTSH
jgi:hypothetical protein